jgi:hypothetical protein
LIKGISIFPQNSKEHSAAQLSNAARAAFGASSATSESDVHNAKQNAGEIRAAAAGLALSFLLWKRLRAQSPQQV